MSEIVPLMIGTAGHVDHGKTSLLDRLTRGAPHADRLPEEQLRGLTIDIGYAELDLGGERQVGIVDVPGHERFIRNMVAAACGIDLLLLVVAADDGVMPQTREHLEIAALMGAGGGVVALTKMDLVDEELALFAEEDVRDLVGGTFLDGAPVLRVSSTTGAGIDELRETLAEGLLRVRPKAAAGVFRLPIQRSFLLPGHGTVVTGVALSGKVRVGDALEVMPRRRKCRVRAIHVYHREVGEARAGHRVALKLSDVSWREISRGHVVGEPGYLEQAHLLEARFRYLEGRSKKIASNFPVRFHAGTTEVVGRMFLLDRREILPGQEALVQLRLDRPVVVGPGDRYVLRIPSPQLTLGGGTVIGTSVRKISASQGRWARRVRKREETLGDPRRAVVFHTGTRGLSPVSRPEIGRALLLRPDELGPVLDALLAEGLVEAVGRRLLSAEAVARGRGKLRELLERFHRKEPLRSAADRAWVRERLGVTDAVLDVLVGREPEVESLPRGLLRRTGFRPDLSAGQEERLGRIEALVLEGGFTPPREVDVAGLIGANPREATKLLDLLVGAGTVVRVGAGILLHREKLGAAREAVTGWLEERGRLRPADLKDLLGMSRKYSIPFLEWLDAQRITIRQGDHRILG